MSEISESTVSALNFTISECESSKQKTYVCSPCKEPTDSLEKLAKHLESHEQRSDKAKSAKKTLNFQENANEALPSICGAFSLSHLTEEPTQNSILSSNSAVNSVMTENTLPSSSSTLNQQLGYICTLCGKQNQTLEDLQFHVKTHQNCENVGTHFQCSYCKETFDNNISLRLHNRLMHRSEDHSKEKLKCDFCDATFVRFSDLRLHQENNHISNYKCTFCGMEFAQIHEVSKHIDIVHHGLQNTNWN